MVNVACFSCKQQFAVMEKMAGELIYCPYCQCKQRAPELVAILAEATIRPAEPGPSKVRREVKRQKFWTQTRYLGMTLLLSAAALMFYAFYYMESRQQEDQVTVGLILSVLGLLLVIGGGKKN